MQGCLRQIKNVEESDFVKQMMKALALSKARTRDHLIKATTKIAAVRNLLCLKCGGHTHDASATSYKKACSPCCEDFVSAFEPAEMRCLALVSHNGMKSTMKEFVLTYKHLLKKFRLTGTNSTMTMLKEVFKDEINVIYGPVCQSGPLGGDAELVALMYSGRLGGVIFFQDPMDAHPHASDILCLCRQALVHNTMFVSTPTSAYMMMYTLKAALEGEGKPELIPSFFTSLQSPSVAKYKLAQKKVIASHVNDTEEKRNIAD